ncbi:MAG: hypothetical protein DRP81_03295, partial [Candidatus Omnitrophota bacterium]
MQLKLLGLILLITNEFKKRKEKKPMQTKENLSQTVKDVKVEIIKDVFKKENTANAEELLDAI